MFFTLASIGIKLFTNHRANPTIIKTPKRYNNDIANIFGYFYISKYCANYFVKKLLKVSCGTLYKCRL